MVETAHQLPRALVANVAHFSETSSSTSIYCIMISHFILINTQTKRAKLLVASAVMALGASEELALVVLAALPLGQVEAVPGITGDMLSAASEAWRWSYAHGLKITALSSLAFGGLGLVMCLLLENIDGKMNDQTNVFLENDVNADKNEFH